MLAGDDHVTLEPLAHPGTLFTAVLEFLFFGLRGIQVRHQAEFQVGHRTQDALGLGRVLDPGQLHHDTAAALALYQGFGNPQLVDPVAQGGQVLADGVIGDLADHLLGHGGVEDPAVTLLHPVQEQLGVLVGDQLAGSIAVRLTAEAGLDPPFAVLANHAADTLLPQQTPHRVLIKLLAPLHRGIDIHFQLEVHPATEVEAQFHRLRTEVTEPLRRGGREVQGDDIAVAEGALQARLAHQLLVGTAQANQGVAATGIDLLAEVLNASLLQGLGGPRQGLLVDHLGAAGTGYLQGRIGGVEVGCRVEQPEAQHGQYQQVFPQRVGVQHDITRARKRPSIIEKQAGVTRTARRAALQLIPASGVRCGTGAARDRPRPIPPVPRSAGRCGSPAPGVASSP